MQDLSDAGWSQIELGSAAEAFLNAKGFTAEDVKLLQDAHQRGGWGRGQFASNDFSQYLAIWKNTAGEMDAPALVIVRFAKTGTYALLVQGKIVASAKTLGAILPALTIAASPAAEK